MSRARARYAILALLFLVGCLAPSCRKSTATGEACPPAQASAIMTTMSDLPAEASKALSERLDKLRKGGRRTVRYKAPTLDEERAHAAWVRDALIAATERKSPPKKAPSGFALRVFGDIWILEETRRKKRGAGAIVIRTGRARPILVEAPHTFFDGDTLPIALAVFESQLARALLINTVHRYIDRPAKTDDAKKTTKKTTKKDAGEKEDQASSKNGDGDDKEERSDSDNSSDSDENGLSDDSEENSNQPDRDEIDDPDAAVPIIPSDVAHTDRSFFLAAHRELLALLKNPTTVQIHGFRDEKAKDTGIIASAAKTSADAKTLAARLSSALIDTDVQLYPTDIQILGGTMNAQARACRELGAPFFHIEIARSLRDKLGSDKALRARFAAALDPIFSAKPEKPAKP